MLREPVTFRRVLTGATLILACLLFLAGMATTPWEPEETTVSFVETIAARSTQGQVVHYSWVALAGGVAGLFTVLRRRGSVLGHLAGVLTVVGTINLSGLLLVDWFAIALGNAGLPLEQAASINDSAMTPILAAGWAILALAGFVLGTPAFLLALWRSGFLPWCPAAVLFAGLVLGEVLPARPLLSVALAVPYAIALGYVGLRVLRTDDVSWATAALPVDVDDEPATGTQAALRLS